jgi:5'-3' exonuclease
VHPSGGTMHPIVGEVPSTGRMMGWSAGVVVHYGSPMRVHLVDGTFELFRAHFTKRPGHTAPSGQDVKAAVGVVYSLLALLVDPDERATHLAVAFDNPIRSFRNDLYAGYKTEEGVAPEILAQFDLVERAVRAIGIVVWSMDRWEADDALATAVRLYRDQVEQVRILTPDKDLGQCLSGTKVVQVDRIRRRVIDEETLWTMRGVRPPSIPDWLALVGDTADGFPGLPGFGEKTAASLLAQFGHLEDIPAKASAWPASVRGRDKLAVTLAGHREDALLFRKLATLATDVPLAEDLAALEWKGVRKGDFAAFCDEVGADGGLRSRPHRFAPG